MVIPFDALGNVRLKDRDIHMARDRFVITCPSIGVVGVHSAEYNQPKQDVLAKFRGLAAG